MEELSDALVDQQIALTAEGANIGRVVVRITDAITDDALYVSADDVLFGRRSKWYSPLVRGLSTLNLPTDEESMQAIADDPMVVVPADDLPDAPDLGG